MGDASAVILEVEGRFVFAAIQFPGEKFNTEKVMEWLDKYEMAFRLKGRGGNIIKSCGEIIDAVCFKGNPIILYSKGKNRVEYGPDSFIEVTENYVYFSEEVNTHHAKEINAEKHDKKITVLLDGEELDDILRINFDLSKDLIIVNGSLMVADYIDKYENTIGFYNSENDFLPVAFILDDDTTVHIDIDEKEDGSRICIVEYGYFIDNSEL